MSDYSLVYRTVLTVTEGDAGIVDAGGGLFYKEFTIPAVNTGTAKVNQAAAESRIPALPEPDLTLEHRGAFALLESETKVRIYWRGELQEDPEAGQESVSVMIEVFDLDDVINELLEIDFKLLRSLGYHGENSFIDLHEYNQAKNPVQFRVRVFDSAENTDAATKDLPEGEDFEAGELSRELVTIEWDKETN